MLAPNESRLPSGTVAFVFTDIEGSTARWEHHPQAMREALDQHDGILRSVIASENGHAFKQIGDAFQAAFPDAAAAVAAAVAAQRRLGEDSWAAPIGELRVRMAIHVGAATPRDGDYLAPCLNRLARLLQAGHGGQILLSEASAKLVRGSLPPGIALEDLGRHRFRDLLEAETVFQVLADGLRPAFPPLRSLAGSPNNLPVAPTPLVDRERDLQALVEILGASPDRLVTLTGAGGIGKTRLALSAAAELIETFEDGVFWVALGSEDDPRRLGEAIAGALGLLPAPGVDGMAQVVDYLRHREVLLLLDNFEQLLPAAPIVADLLARTDRSRVLVTSRARLHLRGEREVMVPPLSVPAALGADVRSLDTSPAVVLFVQRAEAANPTFALRDGNAAAVAAICRRLDGLPLAIELAAARVHLLSADEILPRLDAALSLLTAGPRDAPERQRTLRATMAWSHDLLDGDAQRLFHRLAAFRGGAELAAIEAVHDGDVLTPLDGLVSANLLQRAAAGDTTRYVMYQTVHEYANERLRESAEEAAVRDRHAAYFLALAEAARPNLRGPEQRRWLDRLESDGENLLAAIAWLEARGDGLSALRLAASLWRFWSLRGRVAPGRAALERLLAHDSALELPRRADARNGAGVLAWYEGDYAAAAVHYESALEAHRELGQPRAQAALLNNFGILAVARGQFANARTLYEEALVAARDAGDSAVTAGVLHSLGAARAELGDMAGANEVIAESLALYRRMGDREGQAAALHNLALTQRALGDATAARAGLAESLTLSRGVGDRPAEAATLVVQGEMAGEEGDIIAAAGLLAEGLRARADLGDRRAVAQTLESVAALLSAQGQSETATVLLAVADRARTMIGAPKSPNETAGTDATEAAAVERLGRAAFDAAAQRASALDLPSATALALVSLARLGGSDPPA